MQGSIFLLGASPILKRKVTFVNIGLYGIVGLGLFAAQKFCSRVGCAGLTKRIQTHLWWRDKMSFRYNFKLTLIKNKMERVQTSGADEERPRLKVI